VYFHHQTAVKAPKVHTRVPASAPNEAKVVAEQIPTNGFHDIGNLLLDYDCDYT
jgi:hypothetical protein